MDTGAHFKGSGWFSNVLLGALRDAFTGAIRVGVAGGEATVRFVGGEVAHVADPEGDDGDGTPATGALWRLGRIVRAGRCDWLAIPGDDADPGRGPTLPGRTLAGWATFLRVVEIYTSAAEIEAQDRAFAGRAIRFVGDPRAPQLGYMARRGWFLSLLDQPRDPTHVERRDLRRVIRALDLLGALVTVPVADAVPFPREVRAWLIDPARRLEESSGDGRGPSPRRDRDRRDGGDAAFAVRRRPGPPRPDAPRGPVSAAVSPPPDDTQNLRWALNATHRRRRAGSYA